MGSSRKITCGFADQRHCQVETAPHATGVGRSRLPGDITEVEPVEQVADAALSVGAGHMVQVCHQPQVLLAGEQVVHRRELACDADRATNRIGVAGQVVTCDQCLPAVGADQRGQDLHHRGLPGAVGAEQREHGALRNVEVDAVEHHVGAERLAQPGDGDSRLKFCDNHGSRPSEDAEREVMRVGS